MSDDVFLHGSLSRTKDYMESFLVFVYLHDFILYKKGSVNICIYIWYRLFDISLIYMVYKSTTNTLFVLLKRYHQYGTVSI